MRLEEFVDKHINLSVNNLSNSDPLMSSMYYILASFDSNS